MESRPHVRPKIRSKRVVSRATKSAGHDDDDDDLDAMLEHTRQRVESWLSPSRADNEVASRGVNHVERMKASEGNRDDESEVSFGTASRADTTIRETRPPSSDSRPKGILRKPKYTSSDEPTKDGTSAKLSEKIEPLQSSTRASAVVKDTVVERDPSGFAQPAIPLSRIHRSGADDDSKRSALAVDDYIPTDGPHESGVTFDSTNETSEPLILSSMSELLAAASGECSSDTVKNDEQPSVIEAEVSFSCMTSEDYQEMRHKSESVDPATDEDVTEDKENVNVEDGADEDITDEVEESYDTYDDSEDDLLDFLHGHGASEEEEVSEPEPRAFMKLWTPLSSWITPEAVALIQHWRGESGRPETPNDWVPQVVQSDVGASRCAGLMAILKMHLSRSLQELQRPVETKRYAEKRMSDVLRTLDYSQPMAKLDTKLWRAMTCVLLEIVLVGEVNYGRDPLSVANLPASIEAVGMTKDEFRYLTRSAVTSLSGTGSAHGHG